MLTELRSGVDFNDRGANMMTCLDERQRLTTLQWMCVCVCVSGWGGGTFGWHELVK